jgi:hypothetical protein
MSWAATKANNKVVAHEKAEPREPARIAAWGLFQRQQSATTSDAALVKAALEEPNFLLKIIPHVDGSPGVCELVEYRLEGEPGPGQRPYP